MAISKDRHLITCPKCNPTAKELREVQFQGTATVTQDWIVDARGNFLEEITTVDVTHDPDTYRCDVCGEEAIIWTKRTWEQKLAKEREKAPHRSIFMLEE